MTYQNDNENKIGFIINRYQESGFHITEVNVDAIKSNQKDFAKNIDETVNIYHTIVNDGIEHIEVKNDSE